MSSEDVHEATTSVSLLSRLQKDDNDAWVVFVDRYGSRLNQWCLHRGLQPADSEDVTQNVLVKLARNMKTFQYDPKLTFRGWLRRVTENAVIDFQRERRARHEVSQLAEVRDLFDTKEDRDDLLTRLGEAFDLEILEHAMDRVRRRVEPQRWQAWKMTAQDLKPGREVADALQMPIASVYTARFQVQKLISEEVQTLETAQQDKGM